MYGDIIPNTNDSTLNLNKTVEHNISIDKENILYSVWAAIKTQD